MTKKIPTTRVLTPHHHDDCILCQMGDCDGTGWEVPPEEPSVCANIVGIGLWLVFLALFAFAFYDGFLPPLLDWMRSQ